jgi:hypothetical protein
MGHPGWSLESNCLRDTFEILAMTAKTVVDSMAELVDQSIQELDWLI